MHVLRATDRTQGEAPDDFCWATPGELVRLPYLECADRRCGCDRAVAGLTSHLATTTFVVDDDPALTRRGLRALLEVDLVLQGVSVDHGVAAWLDGEVDLLAAIAAAHDTGTVLARRGDRVVVRSPPAAPGVR